MKGIEDAPPFFTGLLLLGLAHLGLGQYEKAFNCLNELTDRLESEPVLMHWILYRPLHHGLSQYWLAKKDFAQARQEAERVCELAAQSGERTYLALGRRTLAEIAIAQRRWDTAEAELSQALTVIDGTEVPLAEWRVCATAAQLYERRRPKAEADYYWKRSAAVLTRLADTLGDAVELRQSLLTAPPVRVILQHARMRV